MIELIYSNRTERLLEALVVRLEEQRAGGGHPLDPVEIVVPNRNMETWVSLGLARHTGVAANLRCRRLEHFFGDLVLEAFEGRRRLVDLDTIESAILSILLDREQLEEPDLEPVRSYLQAAGIEPSGCSFSFDAHLSSDGVDLRRVQLASRLAYLFQEYSYGRPEMIASWREPSRGEARGRPLTDPAAIDPVTSPTLAWQRVLWRAVFGRDGVLERSPPTPQGSWTTLDLLATDDDVFERLAKSALPPVHIFGVSYVARLFQLLFARLCRVRTLRVYSLNPCAEYWEDVETHRELLGRLKREGSRHDRPSRFGAVEQDAASAGDEDPFGLSQEDTPALRYWGRPGREHVRLLGELTGCDFQGAFEDPLTGRERSGLLHFLQKDILFREPPRSPKPEQAEESASDQTLRFVAAPSIRREVEWVADEIWRLMREDEQSDGGPSLRFSDVAVIVNSEGRDAYLPQIESVFAACNEIPRSVSDLPGASGSRLIEAMSLLLELPFGRLSRAEVLSFMSHPAVIGHFDGASPEELARQAEALGIIFGADLSDHEGTYVDEDVLSWDQGIRRLALGAFMTGEKSGDERVFESPAGRWLVEENNASSFDAPRFGLLARSLISDARFVRERKMTLTDWGRFYSTQLDAYLAVEQGADSGDRLRCLRALGRLEAMDQGCKVSGRIASKLAGRAIESLGGGRGQYLAEGVVVSSFLPMRAIPFKVIFVLGLGEGLFPASGRHDALDLRAGRRRAGDVDPSERDRYMFLETLLCAREKLYLSYVRRDEQTGDPLQPSAVVQELAHILETGYLDKEGIERLRVEPPLWRFDETFASSRSFLDEARIEARVQDAADSWRDHMQRSIGRMLADYSLSHVEELRGDLEGMRRVVSEDSWTRLSSLLALPGEPPPVSAVTVTPVRHGPGDEERIEESISISLSNLRRFLACPMQGWASTMLGLHEEEEDLLDREEEDFEIGMLMETSILRESFLDAAEKGLSASSVHQRKAARLRLSGAMPVGVLGRAILARHEGVLEGWQTALLAYLDHHGSSSARQPAESAFSDQASIPLHRVRLGRASRDCASETVMDPLVLDVTLDDSQHAPRKVPVRISGRTEGLTADRGASIVLKPRRPPSRVDDAFRGRFFRDLLGGIVDHAVLSAIGAAGELERRVALCLSGGREDSAVFALRLRPLSQKRALAWLSETIADLLGGSHGYLLPCEAVFLDYVDRTSRGRKPSRKEDVKTRKESDPRRPDGDRISAHILKMSKSDRSSFSSLWGPVPSPRSYEPPPSVECARIVERRFGPLFDDILDLEGFR